MGFQNGLPGLSSYSLNYYDTTLKILDINPFFLITTY